VGTPTPTVVRYGRGTTFPPATTDGESHVIEYPRDQVASPNGQKSRETLIVSGHTTEKDGTFEGSEHPTTRAKHYGTGVEPVRTRTAL